MMFSKNGDYPESLRQPVWMLALAATGCVALGQEGRVPVDWSFDGRRASYTNCSDEQVIISPFNLRLQPGESLDVWWDRGETSYTLRQVA